MAEARRYPHGVTSWIDTEQPDLEAAHAFYTGLFGWTLTDAVGPDAPDSYLVATLDGQDVAALAPTAATGPARWTTYVAVDDADATSAAVPAGGGTLIRPPEDAGRAGRSALCADPFGAEFGLWQAGSRLGAQRVNSPGAWNFSNLHTPDRDVAMAFYTPLFGWREAPIEGAGPMLQVPGYGDHLAATSDPDIYERQASAPAGFADVIGGLVVIGAGEAPRWHVIFTVADRDDSAAAAERLGATIVSSSDHQWSRDALVRDPQGAEFTVSQFAPPDGDW
jgi:uncharacterized protein